MSCFVFLDLDGVLITRPSWSERRGTDPNCVEALNVITDRTEAKIVLSSTWRLGTPMEEMRAMFKQWGVRGHLWSYTPRMPTYERGWEILNWLQCNALPYDPFVILDDDKDMGPLTPRLIKTSFERGLTLADAHAAIRLLNAPTPLPALRLTTEPRV